MRAFFARRARPTQSVDDLVQEVYERLLRYRSHEPVKDPLGYLFMTAWNVLKADSERKRRDQRRTVACDTTDLESLADGFRRLWTNECRTYFGMKQP